MKGAWIISKLRDSLRANGVFQIPEIESIFGEKIKLITLFVRYEYRFQIGNSE